MHRYFKINEEQLKYLIEADIRRIKSWKYYNNFQKFSKKYPDHTYEFNWFNPKETGLNNEILLDECANYIHDKHPLFIYFRNGKSLSENLIPVAVHRYKPFLLDNKIRLKISENSLHKIFSFIKNNYYAIVEYANGRIGYEDALNCFKMQALNEQMLVEMPIFNDYELHLPTSIWIDGKRDLQHGRRIKFKDTESNNSRNWATMSIDKFNPKIFNCSDKTRLSPQDIEKLKDFVRINYETLMMAADGKLQNKSEIKSRLLYNDDISTIIPQDENTINIECSVLKDRIYFIGEDMKNAKLFIEKITKIMPFHKYSEQTAYIDVLHTNGNGYELAENIKNILYKIAKEMKLKLNLVNTHVLVDAINNIKQL